MKIGRMYYMKAVVLFFFLLSAAVSSSGEISATGPAGAQEFSSEGLKLESRIVAAEVWEKSFAALMDERDRRYEARFSSQEKAVAAALEASEKATEKADAATEKRFESVNEFRAALSDKNNTFLTRTEYEGAFKGVTDRLGEHAVRLETMATRADLENIHKSSLEKDTSLEQRVTAIESRAAGSSSTGSNYMTIVALLISLCAVVISFFRKPNANVIKVGKEQ